MATISPPLVSPPLFIAGPTASGKSALALAFAEKHGGEIISADSMQVYRGLDIGTAKPLATEARRVPHHLVDVCDLRESFDAAQFVRLAQKAMGEIQGRGRIPVFCGGTGLYLKAFMEGIGEAPPADPALRAELETLPLATLLAELGERDPATLATIDQKNPRRVIRAIEVIRLTGKPFSAQRADWQAATVAPQFVGRYFCLKRESSDLHQRIHVRVDEMFRRGLVAETERLLSMGLMENQTARQAIGYRQVIEHLQGKRSLAETVELVKIRTRQFAKRQLTWFRGKAKVNWISLSADEPVEKALAQLEQHLAGQ